MILVIDTSSSRSVLATIDGGRRGELIFNPRKTPISMQFPYVVKDVSKLVKVAVATGPGSFTGLRVGVSFALGLAIGRRLPIVPLPTLGLQAARSDEPVTAVGDAGRGRFYFLTPGGRPQLGQAANIPTTFPLVGWVGKGEATLIAAGHRFKAEKELRWYVYAAAKILETAREVPYGSLEIEYMQSIAVPRK